MKKTLIISYMFPPIAGAGTQRPLKFIKYLPEYGIQPVVFCPQKASWKAYDETLLTLPFLNKIKIYRCGIRYLQRYYNLRYKQSYKSHPHFYWLGFRFFFFLDIFSAWYFECRHQLLEIVKKEKIDCVLTTSPPHSIHLFGLFLKKRAGIPWIMDIRDAIVGDPNTPLTLLTRIQEPIRFLHEKRFYSSSDMIISVSDSIIESINKRHRTLQLPSKLWTIPNGFDVEDFKNISPDRESRKYLLITYTGSFMGRRTPEHFLKAISLLVEKKLIDPKNLLIRFVGYYDEEIRNLCHRFIGLFPIEILEFQLYEKSLRHQENSDILLLIVSEDEYEKDNQTIPGKFYEYLGAKRPIFALAPFGLLKDIILEGNFGYVAPPIDVSKIADRFKEIYDIWKSQGKISFRPDMELRSRFSRKRLTGKLASIIKSV